MGPWTSWTGARRLGELGRDVPAKLVHRQAPSNRIGLVKAVGSAGIEPLVKHERGQGQYSRVPTSILFDEKLSRTAKRVFVALALFSSGLGDSRAAVVTLSRASSTNHRNVHKGLRELENHCRVTRMGAVGRGVQRYNLVGQVIHRAPKSGSKQGAKWATRATPTAQSGQTTATPKWATTATLS